MKFPVTILEQYRNTNSFILAIILYSAWHLLIFDEIGSYKITSY